MTRILVVVTLLLCRVAFAATAQWTGINIMSERDAPGKMQYSFDGDIYGENGASSWILSWMAGHSEAGGFYLKHDDFSKESIEPTFNWWALALYGEVVSEATFDSLTHIEDFRDNDWYTGGTLIENPDDFYMAFKVSEVLLENHEYVEGHTWYGWVHVSLDDNLNMTLLGEGINLSGGAVTVGTTPEPSSALLLLVGGALLTLRRRRGNPQL